MRGTDHSIGRKRGRRQLRLDIQGNAVKPGERELGAVPDLVSRSSTLARVHFSKKVGYRGTLRSLAHRHSCGGGPICGSVQNRPYRSLRNMHGRAAIRPRRRYFSSIIARPSRPDQGSTEYIWCPVRGCDLPRHKRRPERPGLRIAKPARQKLSPVSSVSRSALVTGASRL